jgi:hypothetical protein
LIYRLADTSGVAPGDEHVAQLVGGHARQAAVAHAGLLAGARELVLVGPAELHLPPADTRRYAACVLRLLAHLVVIGQVLFCAPHHAPVRRSVEVSVFRARDHAWVGSRRTSRLGGFTIRLVANERYAFRVRSRGLCYTTTLTANGKEGQRIPVSIRVPTKREHRCVLSSSP